MKKILAGFLCLALLCSMMLPVLSAEATDPTEPVETPAPVPNASHVMAIVCAVVAIAGGLYLFFGWKRSKRF